MLIPQTADLLAAEEHERGRNVVVCLDEASNKSIVDEASARAAVTEVTTD